MPESYRPSVALLIDTATEWGRQTIRGIANYADIRTNAGARIQVSDVLRAVPVSRSWLERRFQELLGRSPAEEIRRVRLERTKRLLAETDLPVPEVAIASGFGSSEYLAYAFKQATGLTPREFRTRTRGW